ncbi:MAG: DUF1018 domain-containing protein [Candidatus Brocadia sp.]|nr:DUF1018 domain-containing protein [Candidatus Brocadia sp.]
MAKGITKAQLVKIWTKSDELGMPEKRLRNLIKWVSGQRSSRKLTMSQAKRLIDVLEGKKPMPVTTRKKKCCFGERATPGQLSLIGELVEETGKDSDYARNFCKKYYKVDSIDELDTKRAGVFIDYLFREKSKRRKGDTHELS